MDCTDPTISVDLILLQLSTVEQSTLKQGITSLLELLKFDRENFTIQPDSSTVSLLSDKIDQLLVGCIRILTYTRADIEKHYHFTPNGPKFDREPPLRNLFKNLVRGTVCVMNALLRSADFAPKISRDTIQQLIQALVPFLNLRDLISKTDGEPPKRTKPDFWQRLACKTATLVISLQIGPLDRTNLIAALLRNIYQLLNDQLSSQEQSQSPSKQNSYPKVLVELLRKVVSTQRLEMELASAKVLSIYGKKEPIENPHQYPALKHTLLLYEVNLLFLLAKENAALFPDEQAQKDLLKSVDQLLECLVDSAADQNKSLEDDAAYWSLVPGGKDSQLADYVDDLILIAELDRFDYEESKRENERSDKAVKKKQKTAHQVEVTPEEATPEAPKQQEDNKEDMDTLKEIMAIHQQLLNSQQALLTKLLPHLSKDPSLTSELNEMINKDPTSS